MVGVRDLPDHPIGRVHPFTPRDSRLRDLTEARLHPIEWRASTSKDCFNSTNFLLATKTVTLGINDEFHVGPPSGYLNFSSVPVGFYYVCAKIDPDDLVVETDDADNGVNSDLKIEVKPLGSVCPY
jgi:hypothetical protein